MDSIDKLPDIEREVLRQLYFAPGHTSTVDDLWGKIYYPNEEITSALALMVERGLIVHPLDDTDLLQVSADVLPLLQAKNLAADQELAKGLRNLGNLAENYRKEKEE